MNTIALFLAALCCPVILVHGTDMEPCDTADKREAAIEACSFLLESSSTYSECLLEMDLEIAKEKFKMCMDTYCESGIDGVCSFAEMLAYICNNTWNVVVQLPEACEKTTTTTTTTTTTKPPTGPCETPEEREKAEEVCSFMLESNSQYSKCLLAMGLDQAKRKFQKCVEIYCEEGLGGVCTFAISLAEYCENMWSVDIDDDDLPEHCVTTVSPTPTPYPLCIDAPEKDENAVAACSFLLDGTSSLYPCLRYIDYAKIMRFYKICLQIFCDMGYNGVCCFAEHIPEICSCQYHIEVNLNLDFCLPETTPTTSPTTPSYICVDEPAQDEQAIEACSWLLEYNSPFYPCGIVMGLEKVKQFFQICVHTYCNAGKLGVCAFADNVRDICISKDVMIGHIIPECAITTTTTTTTTKSPSVCDNPIDEQDAKKMCFLLWTSDSPFFDCFSKIDSDKIAYLMKKCMMAYCEEGIEGFCEFVDGITEKCEDEYNVQVTGGPDVCEEVTTTLKPTESPECVGNPMNDENAIEACDFLLDVDSPYYECLHEFTMEKRKLMFTTCTEAYCESGIEGVCRVAENIADICKETEKPVDALPEICEKPTRPPSKCDNDDEKERAMEACSFILDANTIFSDCLDKFDMHKRKKMFMICLEIYCDEGMEGVCCFAEHIPVICEVQYDIIITGTIDECQETTTAAPRCEDEPHRDSNARKACEDLIDTDSPFRPCIEDMELDMVKRYYSECVEIYCSYGGQAVCKLFKTLTYYCKDTYDITIAYECKP